MGTTQREATQKSVQHRHPPVAPGERPPPYRDAQGVKWHWWMGRWRKVKNRSTRRAQRRVKRLSADFAKQWCEGADG